MDQQYQQKQDIFPSIQKSIKQEFFIARGPSVQRGQLQGNWPKIKLDEKHQNTLFGGKRFYKKQKWADQIVAICLDTDFQSTTIQLHYGLFATKINIINFYYSQNLEKGSTCVGLGQFGKVLLTKFEDQLCAVKMIHLSGQNIFPEMKHIYKEYFIALIASQLKVGAKIVDLFGYQIVFFKDYAFFGMEFCRSFGSNNQPWQNLSQSLDILHSIHIIHRDIKTQNIVWSPNYNKYVFIDFGLSLMIKQNSNEKTETFFAGSYTYCSPQMKKTFLLKSSGLVNLYQNDCYGLNECKKLFIPSLFQNQVFSNMSSMNHQDESEGVLSAFSKITLIIKAIFDTNFQSAYLLLKNSKDKILSCLYIVNKVIEKKVIPEDIIDIWKELKNILKQKILQIDYVKQNIDDVLIQILENNSIGKYLPFTLLSQKFAQKFHIWSQNQLWIERTFLFLFPIHRSDLNQNQLHQYSYKIINKIYQGLKLPPTKIYLKKVREVLLFFYQKFKKYKKGIILQSLSDALFLIKDHLSAVQIRTYILQQTEDPIQYCLQSLKYYLLNQYQLKPYRIAPYDFLVKIGEKISMLADKKQSKIVSLILQIKQSIQNMLSSNICEKLDNILIILQQVKQQILFLKLTQLTEIVCRIQVRTILLYEKTIYIILSKNIFSSQERKYSEMKLNWLICKRGSYKQVHHGCVGLVITNSIFYLKIKQQELQNFFNTSDYSDYFKFFYEMGQGCITFMQIKIYYQLKKMITMNKSVICFILKQKINWIPDDGQSLQISRGFQQFYWYMKIVFDYIIIIVRQKNKKGLWEKDTDEKQFLFLTNAFSEKIKKNIDKQIKESYQKEILSLLIKNYQLCLRCYHMEQYSEQEIIQEIEDIFNFIKQHQNYKQVDIIEYSTNQILFIKILIVIGQNQLFKIQQNMTFVEDMFIQLFKFMNDQSLCIAVSGSLKLMISILIKRNRNEIMLNILQDTIFYYNKNQIIFDKKPQYTQNLIKSILYFSQTNPQQITKSTIRSYNNQNKKKNLSMLLSDSHGCLFLFVLLSSVKDERQFAINFLYKISLNMHSIKQIIKVYIMSCYYILFVEEYQIKKKKRKLLSSLRQYNRYEINPVSKKKIWLKITKIIQKVKWPKKYYYPIMSKIHIF